MSRLLSLLIFVAVVFVAFHIYRYWEKVNTGELQKEVAAQETNPESLTGMPYSLNASLKAAEQGGKVKLGKWLEAHAGQVQDPRLAWIELDYAEALLLSNPAEAKAVYDSVAARISTNSPVHPRLRQLKKSFE